MTIATDLRNDYFAYLDTFADTIAAIKGFERLLTIALSEEGGALKPHGEGIATLLNQQAQDLDLIREGLADLVNQINASKLNVTNIEGIARASGVSREIAETVILVATGIDLSEIGGKHALYEGLGKETLNRIVGRNLASERAIPVIAQAVELPEDQVREILEAAIVFRPSEAETMDPADHAAMIRRILRSPPKIETPDSSGDDDGAGEPSTLTAKELRDQFIAEKVKQGIDTGEIAQAVNLKRSTVEKVIGQLLAGRNDPDTAIRPTAVNE